MRLRVSWGEVRCRLEREKTFTSKADVGVVDQLYRSFFQGATRFATRLDFSGLAWRDEQVLQLAEVLPCFAKLTALDLSRNVLQAAGATAIAGCVCVSASLTEVCWTPAQPKIMVSLALTARDSCA